MVVKNFDTSLANLVNGPVQVSPGGAFPEPGCASVQIIFENGSRLHAQYWRIIESGKPSISSFDHQQKYGLQSPIDAVKEFQKRLENKIVADARICTESVDLFFFFVDGIKLQVFSFTGYEDWEIHFPDNTGEYSNYVP